MDSVSCSVFLHNSKYARLTGRLIQVSKYLPKLFSKAKQNSRLLECPLDLHLHTHATGAVKNDSHTMLHGAEYSLKS